MLPLRLRRVAGLEGRVNDALFTPAALPPAHTLVYFGGDVQDYPEAMRAHRDHRRFVRWNLESTARLLARTFPHNHIVVVRPSRIEFSSFSCYDNFVPSNNAGVPDHTPTHSALTHLERLLQGVSSRVKAMPAAELLQALAAAPPDDDLLPPSAESTAAASDALQPPSDPLWWVGQLALDAARLTLVGFSKGCVVLNQLVYELHYTQTLTPGDLHAAQFISRISDLVWLDGGHAGGRNTWLTARALLETLARLDLNIHIHVSPYQVQDESRPWIGREEKVFTSLLRKLGAKVHRSLHAAGAPHSLHSHFEVLAAFARDHSATLTDHRDATASGQDGTDD